MVVVCIDDNLVFFTKGEYYTVINSDFFFGIFEIENDIGTTVIVKTKSFKKLTDYRNEVISNILK